jgi:hypothetical protein
MSTVTLIQKIQDGVRVIESCIYFSINIGKLAHFNELLYRIKSNSN